MVDARHFFIAIVKWSCVVVLVCRADYYSCYFSGNIFVCAEVSIVLDVFHTSLFSLCRVA